MTFPGEHFENQFYRQQLFALLSKMAPFYFHNARRIYLRSGRAISLDRKFNTAVTEASIKIDENIPADVERTGIVAGWYYAQLRKAAASLPEGPPSRQSVKDPEERETSCKKKGLLYLHIGIRRRIGGMYSLKSHEYLINYR